MKVKYGENVYCFEGDLDCLLFFNLIEEEIEEVELSMFENIFKSILNNTLIFEEEKDYITLYQGLSYFGSKKEKELIDFLRNKIYTQEKKILQKEITDFFEETENGIQFNLCYNTSLPFEFIQKHFNSYIPDIWLNGLCRNENIPSYFFEKYLHRIEWYYLCKNKSIPFDFFKKHLDKIKFSYLCLSPNIPLDFLKENLHRIDWEYLCKNPSIPLEFFKEHLFCINWESLCENPSIPLEFFKEHLDKIRICWPVLCQNPSIPIEYFKKNIDKVNNDVWCWSYLCSNPSIPLEFFKEHLDKIHWDNLCKNPSVPIEFFQEHILYIDKIECLQTNPNVSIESLRKMKIKDMKKVCENHFNLEKRIRDKIKNTVYFDFKPLNELIVNFFKNEK